MYRRKVFVRRVIYDTKSCLDEASKSKLPTRKDERRSSITAQKICSPQLSAAPSSNPPPNPPSSHWHFSFPFAPTSQQQTLQFRPIAGHLPTNKPHNTPHVPTPLFPPPPPPQTSHLPHHTLQPLIFYNPPPLLPFHHPPPHLLLLLLPFFPSSPPSLHTI